MSILIDSQGFLNLHQACPKAQLFSNPHCYRKEVYACDPFIEALLRIDRSNQIAREDAQNKNRMAGKGVCKLGSHPSSSSHKRGRYKEDDSSISRQHPISLSKHKESKNETDSKNSSTTELENSSPLKKTRITLNERNDHISDTEKLKIPSGTSKQSRLSPNMNLKETLSQYQISISLPGGSKESIKIDFIKSNNKLIISGKLPKPSDNLKGSSDIIQNGFFLNEITNFGEFERAIQFENNIDVEPNSMRAILENGILYIVLNKKKNQEQTAEDPEVQEIAAQKSKAAPIESSTPEASSQTENTGQQIVKQNTKIHEKHAEQFSAPIPKVRRITVEFD